MQYELRLREEHEAGKREGKREGFSYGKVIATVDNIRLFMENINISADKVMQMLKVPEKEQDLYLRLVNDPAPFPEKVSERSRLIGKMAGTGNRLIGKTAGTGNRLIGKVWSKQVIDQSKKIERNKKPLRSAPGA